MGPVVRQLRELYFNIVRGRVVRYRAHCVPVYNGAKAPSGATAGAFSAGGKK
jgi:hypothetical protein